MPLGIYLGVGEQAQTLGSKKSNKVSTSFFRPPSGGPGCKSLMNLPRPYVVYSNFGSAFSFSLVAPASTNFLSPAFS